MVSVSLWKDPKPSFSLQRSPAEWPIYAYKYTVVTVTLRISRRSASFETLSSVKSAKAPPKFRDCSLRGNSDCSQRKPKPQTKSKTRSGGCDSDRCFWFGYLEC